MRVSSSDEEVGLDISEHNAPTELGNILAFFEHQHKTGDLSKRLELDSFTDFGLVAKEFNKVLNKLEGTELELKEKNDLLAQFAGNVSHDLKNNISSILGFSRLIGMGIEREDLSNDNLIRFSSRISDQANKINRTIHTYLNFAMNGLTVDSLGKVDLRKVFRKVLNELTEMIDERNVDIRIKFTEPYVYANDTFVVNIFSNIVTNAIKYKSADRNPVIKLNSDLVGDNICIRIIDNGIGIKQDKLGEIFKSFARGYDNEKFTVEGQGLGLSSVKLMLESMGAKFDVSSKVDEGSVLSMKFPKVSS